MNFIWKDTIKIMKQILITMLLLLGAMGVSAQGDAEMSKEDIYKAEVREKLQLDYSMPDYSTSKIDAKLMGPRLAELLESISENYQQYTNLSALSVIQSNQVEGLSYGRIKKLKFDNATKQGNEIIIRFNTTLESNNLNLKKSQIAFQFSEGVSDDILTNDFFLNICRYLKE